jgi:tetratricopeptide (TPR) repeat protein
MEYPADSPRPDPGPRGDCPSAEVLQRYRDGRLSAEERTRLAPHIDVCPYCQAKLDEGDSRLAEIAGHAPPTPPPIPKYEYLREEEGFPQVVGRGGLGVVFLACYGGLTGSPPRAVKVLHTGHPITPRSRERFLLEIEAVTDLARQGHPGFVQIFERGEAGGCLYYVMEYVPGGNLQRLLREYTPVPHEAAEWLLDLAQTMVIAHRNGIIHRDLKPSNILVVVVEQDAAGTTPHVKGLKIADFSHARLLHRDSNLTEGEPVGTPNYMTPEQARGEQADARADVYGLCAILYEMLTGRPPFDGPTPLATMELVRSPDHLPPPPAMFRPDLARGTDVDLVSICMKGLDKDRRHRYGTVDALAEDLRRYLDGRSTRARPLRWPARLARWAWRKPALAGLSATVALLSLLLLIGGPTTAIQQKQLRAVADSQKERAVKLGESSRRTVEELVRTGALLGQRMERVAEAASVFTLAADTFEALLAEGVENEIDCRFFLGLCRNNIANCRRLSDPAAAARSYEQAIEEFRRLCQEAPRDGRARDWLVRSQSNLALVLERTGRITEALTRHRAAVRDGRQFLDALQDALRANRDLDRWAPYEFDHHESLAIALTNEGEMLTRLRRRDEAERDFRDALPLYQELTGRVPFNMEYAWSVAMTHTNLGIVLSEGPATRWKEAEEDFNLAAQWYKLAYEGASNDPEFARYWATNRVGLAALKARQAFAAAAPPDAAINLYAEAIQILEKVKESLESRLFMAEYLVRLGTMQRRAGRLAEAETTLTRARELLQPLRKAVPQGPGVAMLQAVSDGQLGKVLARQKRRDDGQRLVNDAAAKLEALAKEYPEDPGIRDARAENAFLRAGLAAAQVDSAMHLLREAVAQGLFNDEDRVRELQTDEDLAPLRSRPDFLELIESAIGARKLQAK